MFQMQFFTDYSYQTPAEELPLVGTYAELSALAEFLRLTFGARPVQFLNLEFVGRWGEG